MFNIRVQQMKTLTFENATRMIMHLSKRDEVIFVFRNRSEDLKKNSIILNTRSIFFEFQHSTIQRRLDAIDDRWRLKRRAKWNQSWKTQIRDKHENQVVKDKRQKLQTMKIESERSNLHYSTLHETKMTSWIFTVTHHELFVLTLASSWSILLSLIALSMLILKDFLTSIFVCDRVLFCERLCHCHSTFFVSLCCVLKLMRFCANLKWNIVCILDKLEFLFTRCVFVCFSNLLRSFFSILNLCCDSFSAISRFAILASLIFNFNIRSSIFQEATLSCVDSLKLSFETRDKISPRRAWALQTQLKFLSISWR